MPRAAASSDALFILMRRMRWPLVIVLSVLSFDAFGLSLIPGQDDNGNVYYMTLFECFYFMSYMASTIGFGEYPYSLTTAQRLWVTFSIYTAVLAWGYALGSLLSLMGDRAFRDAIALQRFVRQVRQLREPFLIIAGYGQMGQRVAETLDLQGRRLVVIDSDPKALASLASGRLSVDVPGIDGDARHPDTLNMAGLNHPYCEGVLALTHNDAVNLSVVMSVQLLRPEVPIYARVDDRISAETMRDFGAEGIINPFDRYGSYLVLRLQRPLTYQLVQWLMAPYGTSRTRRPRKVRSGRWVVVSDEAFGDEITRDLNSAGFETTLYRDTDELPDFKDVVGLVAGTCEESRNLAVAARARLQHPDIFLSVRASSEATRELLTAFDPDSIFIPAQLTAQEALARVVTPDFWSFIQHSFSQDEAWSKSLLNRLVTRCGEGSPTSFRVVIDKSHAPGVAAWLMHHTLTIGDLFRHPFDREHPVAAVPLILTRDSQDQFLPGDDVELQVGDEVVMAGRFCAFDDLQETLFQRATVQYVATGEIVPNTWIFRKLSSRIEDV